MSGIHTRFRDHYKKSGVLSCSEAGRLMRAQKKLADRRVSRAGEFSKLRNLDTIDIENTEGSSTDVRKIKLQKWKEERQQQKLLSKQLEKPVFKVGVVHHKLGSPYLKDTSNMNQSVLDVKVNKVYKNVQKCLNHNNKTTPVSVNKHSFAPANFKFKAPVIKNSVILLKDTRAKSENDSKTVKSSGKSTYVREQIFQPAFAGEESTNVARRVTRSQRKLSALKESIEVPKPVSFQKRGRAIKSSKNALISAMETVDEVNNENNVEVEENCISVTVHCSLENVQVDKVHTPVAQRCTSENAQVDKTPSQPMESEDHYPIQHSPFIMKKRGSSVGPSARRSIVNKVVSDTESDSTNTVIQDGDTSKHGILYFRSVLESETQRLESACNEWKTIQSSALDLPQDASDLISAAIGQTQLLLSKKFVTFHALVDKCEKSLQGENDGPVITCSDLDGFWDMMYREVEDVDCRFNNLIKMKSNNWVEETVTVQKPTGVRRQQKKVQKPATSSLRTLIAAARKKKKLEEMPIERIKETLINTPVAVPKIKRTPSSVRHSRQSLLHEAIMGQRRQSQGVSRESSPIIMKVTQMGKLGNIVTVPVTQTPNIPQDEYKTPIAGRSQRKSILKAANLSAYGEQIAEDLSLMRPEIIDADSKENEPTRYSRKSTRKVRFEGAIDDSPKVVQPMTPFVPNVLRQSNSRRRSDRLSLLGSSSKENTVTPISAEDLISFDSPIAEPHRVLRRSVRLSDKVLGH